MRSRVKKGLVAAATAVAAAAALTIGTAGNSTAAGPTMQAYGITADGLTMAAFKTNTPQVTDWVQDITGLDGDTAAIGIDIRPQNNTLYLVGNKGGIYTLNLVPPPPPPGWVLTASKVGQLTVPLYGTFFGVDFNPPANRLRIISDNGQNLSHDIDGKLTTDQSTLNNNGSPAKGVTAAAYTNVDLNGDTNTTLFDVDTINDTVVIQSPPPTGNLVATGKLTIDVGPNAGLDIFSDLVNGKTVANFGYGTFAGPDGKYSLYDVNLLTGTATVIGKFPNAVQIADVAVALDTM